MKLVKAKDLKKFFIKNEDKIVLIIGIILIVLISFGAGRLTAVRGPKEPIKIEDYGLASVEKTIESQQQEGIKGSDDREGESVKKSEKKQGMFVGSIKSNKYHLPDCSWAKRIKPENIIWFESVEDAEAKGYVPASCCVGRE